MRSSLKVVLSTGLLLLLAGCGQVAANTAASVNGDTIGMDTLEGIVTRRVAQAEQAQGSLPAEERADVIAEGQRQALGLLIQATLLRQAAEERGVSVSQDDVDAALEEQAALMQGGREELEQRIAQIGLTEDQARRYLFSSIALEQAIRESLGGEAEVDEERLRQTYDERIAQFTEVDARHILVETREEAEDILQRLAEGADFAELAEQHSTDTGSAAEGGDLGTSRAGQYVGGFREAVLEAELGEVVGPVETQFGWHVIEVAEREVIPFSEARESIADELRLAAEEEGLQALITDLFESAEVEVNDRIGRWDPQSTTVVPTEPLVPSSNRTEPATQPPGQAPPTERPTAPADGQSGS